MTATPKLRLVAPWYRWQRQAEEDGVLPRQGRPVFQKYADPGLVNRFLEDPQASYRFQAGEDFVAATERSVYDDGARIAWGGPSSGWAGVAVRKLFRPTHKRHYLIVCSLHCDAPGLPDAGLDHACEMGFVIRRWAPPGEGAPAATGVVDGAVAVEEARPAGVGAGEVGGRPTPAAGGSAYPCPGGASGEPVQAAVSGKGAAVGHAGTPAAGLDATTDTGRLQGWIPDPDHEGHGRWVPVLHEPGELREQIHPLHPLVPGPDRSEDPARGARLLFGLVPTETPDIGSDGSPRFDARHLYRIRVFVRRHDARCPRRRERNDCPGPLEWSRASEPYRIASHGDLDGQKNVLVTVEMPDLDQLAAHSGPAGGLRMVSPDGSNLGFEAKGTEPADGSREGFQICTFPIPLITIVARFVFSLFLPVVVFVFQLFFLLVMRICIPPSISLDASFVGEVRTKLADGTLNGDFGVQTTLVTELNKATRKDRNGDGLGTRMVAEHSNEEMWEVLRKLAELPEDAEDGGDGVDGPDGGAPARSPVVDNLVLEERVDERPQVDAPEIVGTVL